MNIRRLIFFALLLCLFISGIAPAQGTRLLRHPTVSRDSVAFEYAGDLWVVSRSGGQARRVTSTQGVELDPYFSPDGSQIAYTSTVAGNTDVYVAALPWGPHASDLSNESGRLFGRETSLEQQQRHAADVDWQYDLFFVRPRSHDEPLCLPCRCQASDAAHSP